ncbi:MAG: hypothetical protein HZB44_07245 [Actinobacteria bacterium]|nr:hypothetical protein [Actinomycetota bacterium]
MGYTQVGLEDRIYEMYPELMQHRIAIKLSFDEGRNAWVVTFEKDGKNRHAFLDKGDADECMDGQSCIYLGTLVAQYIKDLEEELGIS